MTHWLNEMKSDSSEDPVARDARISAGHPPTVTQAQMNAGSSKRSKVL